MTTLTILIVIGIVFLGAVIINGIEEYNKASRKDCMSFRESMDLTDLPIVTFYQGNNRFNFLLDTGANLSVINSSTLNNFQYKEVEGTGNIVGVEGIKKEVSYVNIDLNYKDTKYTEQFQVLDMQDAIDHVKSESGVNMVGILGNNFFRRYKYILDFNELIAYSKK
jgi:hypothetical protein